MKKSLSSLCSIRFNKPALSGFVPVLAALLLAGLTASASEKVFNFGPDGIEVAPGVINTGSTPFSEARGWGWLTPADILRLRNRDSDLLKDTTAGVSAAVRGEAVFQVKLDPGTYTIELSIGDAAFRSSSRVFLQDESMPWVDAGLIPAGQFRIERRTLAIEDGFLRLRLPAAPTPNTPFVSVNYLKIIPVAGQAVTTPAGTSAHGVPPIRDDIYPGQLLPPAALRPGFTTADHPKAEIFNTFLENQAKFTDFEPTGLTEQDYLRLVNGVVLAMKPFQHLEEGEMFGEIVDPWFRPGQYRHYGTPHYAYCVALLAATGYNTDPELLESGILAFNASVERMVFGKRLGNNPHGLQPWTAGDFYTYTMMRAMPHWRQLVSEEQYNHWMNRMKEIVPENTYAQQFQHNNWSVLNGVGEYFRAAAGLTTPDWAERTLEFHRSGISENGTFAAEPFTYDIFPRYYLAGMLQAGYRGPHFSFYRDRMWRGAWLTLFFQTNQGQLITGSRSAHHCWNEPQMSKLFELYASAYHAAGREREARIFKRAARKALSAMLPFIHDDGSFTVVKHFFGPESPTGPGGGHAFELYTQHSCYNLLAASMLGMAYEMATPGIEEAPVPADVGGFAFLMGERYNTWLTATEGTFVQYSVLSGDLYDPSGLNRIHFADSDPVFAPSGGVNRRFGNGRDSFTVGPAWKNLAGGINVLADFRVDPEVEVLEANTRKTVLQLTTEFANSRNVPAGAGSIAGYLVGGDVEETDPSAVTFASRAGLALSSGGIRIGSEDFLLSTEVKARRQSGHETLFAMQLEDNLLGHYLIFEIEPNNRLRVLHRVPAGTGGGQNLHLDGAPLRDGNWHHLAVGRIGGELQVFLNGEKLAGQVVSGSVSAPLTLLVGRLLQERDDRQWRGQIRNIRLDVGSLANFDVAALARGEVSAKPAPVIDWQWDQVPSAEMIQIRETITTEPGRVSVATRFLAGETQEQYFYYPFITTDGRSETGVAIDGNRMRLTRNDQTIEVRIDSPSNVTWEPMGLRLVHGNGFMDIARVSTTGGSFDFVVETVD